MPARVEHNPLRADRSTRSVRLPTAGR